MSLTKLSLARNTLVGDIPAGGGKIANLFFYSVSVYKGPLSRASEIFESVPHLYLEASVVVEGDPFVGEVGVRTR